MGNRRECCVAQPLNICQFICSFCLFSAQKSEHETNHFAVNLHMSSAVNRSRGGFSRLSTADSHVSRRIPMFHLKVGRSLAQFTNVNPISGWFWKFVRASSAKFVGRSTLRIYKNDAQPSASRAACQPIKSCAAHHSGQMLMLEGQTCSLRRAFTTCSASRLSWLCRA